MRIKKNRKKLCRNYKKLITKKLNENINEARPVSSQGFEQTIVGLKPGRLRISKFITAHVCAQITHKTTASTRNYTKKNKYSPSQLKKASAEGNLAYLYFHIVLWKCSTSTYMLGICISAI